MRTRQHYRVEEPRCMREEPCRNPVMSDERQGTVEEGVKGVTLVSGLSRYSALSSRQVSGEGRPCLFEEFRGHWLIQMGA